MNATARAPRRLAALSRAPHNLAALLGLSVFATLAHAQQLPAAAPAAATSSARSAHELGRLFFTPERRQQLDRQRELKTEDKPPPSATSTLTIDGVVTRSSGKRTVWVNGAALDDGATADGVVVGTNRRSPGQVVVHPGDAPAIPAKVGDTVDRATGESGGVLGSGSITSRSTSPR